MSSVSTKSLVLSQRGPSYNPEINTVPKLTHEIVKTSSATTLKVEIPGVDPTTVGMTCEDNTLRIVCERGEFVHAINPLSDPSKIKADIKWGLLVVEIPDPPAPVARSIKISLHDAVKETTNKTKRQEEFTETGCGV